MSVSYTHLLWILNNNKKGGSWHGRQLRDRTSEILFIDLRTWNSNIYEKKYVRLSETEIDRVRQIYLDWQTENFVEYAEPELYYAAPVSYTHLFTNQNRIVLSSPA